NQQKQSENQESDIPPSSQQPSQSESIKEQITGDVMEIIRAVDENFNFSNDSRLQSILAKTNEIFSKFQEINNIDQRVILQNQLTDLIDLENQLNELQTTYNEVRSSLDNFEDLDSASNSRSSTPNSYEGNEGFISASSFPTVRKRGVSGPVPFSLKSRPMSREENKDLKKQLQTAKRENKLLKNREKDFREKENVIAEKEKKITELTEQEKTYKQAIKSLESNNKKLTNELDQTNKENSELRTVNENQITEKQKNKESFQVKIKELEEKLTKQEKECEKLQNELVSQHISNKQEKQNSDDYARAILTFEEDYKNFVSIKNELSETKFQLRNLQEENKELRDELENEAAISNHGSLSGEGNMKSLTDQLPDDFFDLRRINDELE
ncbi:3784_t:CDS:2, partial [Entrophospora sp. SA101]